ncbi:MAG TPA: hypothetical protein VGR91_03695 [Stellaceae bacterium]|nr:hypothetical protein [Stellaceae bacterium]
MLLNNPKAASASRVTALFKTGALSFPLPAGTTFQDLAAHLEGLCASNGKAIAVAVRVAAAPQPSS